MPRAGALRQMLAAAAKKEILARILRNLKSLYVKRHDLDRALSAADRLIVLDPEAAEEYRDCAGIYLDLECLRVALADLRRYLLLRPQAGDADTVRGKAVELEPVAARLN